MSRKLNDFPTAAKASHLLQFIGVQDFIDETEKQAPARAARLMALLAKTDIIRNHPPSSMEDEVMNDAHSLLLSGRVDQRTWDAICALYVYNGSSKDSRGCISADCINYPDNWDPVEDLKFARKVIPGLLAYKLPSIKQFEATIRSMLAAGKERSQTNREEDSRGKQDSYSSDTDVRLELARWDFIKDSQNPADFREHIERFPNGVCVDMAYKRLEALIWANSATQGSISALRAFLKEFPNGDHAAAARARLKELEREKEAAQAAKKKARAGRQTTEEAASRAVLRTFTGHVHAVLSVAFSPDGRFALSGGADNTLKLWDVATGKELRTFTGHTRRVLSVAFSPDGRTALSGDYGGTMKLWDVSTARDLRTFIGHLYEVKSVAYSPDGRTALSGGGSGTLKFWDIASGQELRIWRILWSIFCVLLDMFTSWFSLGIFATNAYKRGHTFYVINSIAYSPDGRTALSGSQDKTLKLWDTAWGRELRTFTGHTRDVFSVAYSPDGRTVLSGSWDKTLKLWDVASGRELHTFTEHSDIVASVAYSPDGRTALSGSCDKTLKLWDLTPYLPRR